MSDTFGTFGNTLTGGIQDLSALLPLIGTEQCEKHIGSALEGGYAYAAATVLSIFGSLGIVKAGIAVLIASISIPKLTLSSKFPRERWLGARVLKSAGFGLPGSVAPKIGMDASGQHGSQRYMAETRLLELLEEKHIDDPEKLSVDSESAEWNISLIVSMTVAAGISIVPYIHLFVKDLPDILHPLWYFPFLRIMGSCLAAISIQFIIQSRIISIMKNRIIFMIIHRLLLDELKKQGHDNPELTLRDQKKFKWGSTLAAEDCLWSLEHWYLRRMHSSGTPNDSRHIGLQMEPKQIEIELPNAIFERLLDLRKKYFPNPTFDYFSIVFSRIFLLLGIPAIIFGYIGCFTLVSSSDNPKGPLVWLALEGALSLIRILVWASDPSFDERTKVTVNLELTEHRPPVTTEKDVALLDGTLPLVPEHRFLEGITQYTGPLEQFHTPQNIALYFTLSGDLRAGLICLFVTVLDLKTRATFTLHQASYTTKLLYSTATTSVDTNTGGMQAILGPQIAEGHPRRTNDIDLFDALSEYYYSLLHALLHALKRTNNVAELTWKWNLVPQVDKSDNQIRGPIESLPLSEHDQLYLLQGYEYRLKTQLVKDWGSWIDQGIEAKFTVVSNDWRTRHGLVSEEDTELEPNHIRKEAEWEIIELDTQLIWERTRLESILLEWSNRLEGVFHQRMEENVKNVENEQLRKWLWSEFDTGQRKRLDQEWEQAKTRMEKARNVATEREGQPDNSSAFHTVASAWQAALDFIEGKWAAVIESGTMSLEDDSFALNYLVERYTPKESQMKSEEDKGRYNILQQFNARIAKLEPLPDIERQRQNMEAAIEYMEAKSKPWVRIFGGEAHVYPKSSSRLGTAIYLTFPTTPAHTALDLLSKPRSVDLEKTWAFLDIGIDYIMTNSENGLSYSIYMRLMTTTYNYCTSAKANTYFKPDGNRTSGRDLVNSSLYSKLSDYFVNHFKLIKDKAAPFQDEHLLRYYTAQWNRIKTGVDYLNRVFTYLNRHWVKRERDEGRNNVYPVNKLALLYWKTYVFLPMQEDDSKLSGAVLRSIERERNGDVIDERLVEIVRDVVSSFASLGFTNTEPDEEHLCIYEEYLEAPLIRQYYEKESAFFAEGTDPKYLEKAQHRLREEEARVERYLHVKRPENFFTHKKPIETRKKLSDKFNEHIDKCRQAGAEFD